MSKAARNSLLLCAAIWLAAPNALQGQERPIISIDEVLGRDLALLKQADERLKSGAPDEAIEILLPLVAEQGEKLVPLSDSNQNYQFTVYVSLREAIFRKVIENEPAVAAMQKRRGEKFSGEEATPGRLNWSVLDQRQADRWQATADEWIRLGKWNDARDYLTPFAAKQDPLSPECLARLAYISLLEGSPQRAKVERNLLASLHNKARGQIAGREENLLERVDAWMMEFSQPRNEQRIFSETHLSFGIVPKETLIWRRDRAEAPAAPARGMPTGGFPKFAEGWLFLSTGDASYLFNLSDPSAANGSWPGPLYRATIKPDRAAEPFGAMRHWLSTSQGFVYGRFGSDVTRKRSAVPVGDQSPGVVVAHDAARGGVLLPGLPLAPGLEEEFDGPPLVRDGRMYLAIRKRDETRTKLSVRCMDVASVKLIWERAICNAETRGRGVRDEASQTSLELDGERLYVMPHLGCVACLDAASGGIRWLTKYPRAEFPTANRQEPVRWQRGLGAMHLRSDSLFVLAADCERVFALDSMSGELKWVSRRELMNDAVYVLGATEEQVVLMGESIYWLDAATGQVKACYPERWVKVGQGRIDPNSAYGRGIWAGDSVWYPTRDALKKVSLVPDGKPHVTSELPLPPIPSLFGNLAYFDERLYWASEECVLAWNSPLEKRPATKPLGAVK